MRKKIATIIATLGLVLTAAVPAGAAASTPDRAAADLSSLPAIEAYLLSIGVDPGSVVVQEGPLNYAGPSCPGADWNWSSSAIRLAGIPIVEKCVTSPRRPCRIARLARTGPSA